MITCRPVLGKIKPEQWGRLGYPHLQAQRTTPMKADTEAGKCAQHGAESFNKSTQTWVSPQQTCLIILIERGKLPRNRQEDFWPGIVH